MDATNKKKKSKVFYMIIVSFIFIILATIGLLYFTNESFKGTVDEIFKETSFNSKKSKSININESELNQKKEDIAEYYVSKGMDSVYELYAIKTKDELLYSDIVKIMNKKSSSITSKLIKEVRNLEDMDDILTSMHSKIIDENQAKILEEARRLENMDTITAINEMEIRMKDDSSFVENINDIFANMDDESLCNMLYYMDEEMRQSIYSVLDDDLKSEINNMIKEKDDQYNKLVDIARLYEDKSIDVLLQDIGNTEIYDIDELAVIYSNLSLGKSGEILSRVDNDEFIQDLIAAIREEEQLRKKDSIVADMNSAIQFIKEYNTKIGELVNFYENMEPNKAAYIMENMLENSSTLTRFTLESEPIYEVTNSSIVVDILKNMKKNSAAKILNYMKTENVTKLTQMLASP